MNNSALTFYIDKLLEGDTKLYEMKSKLKCKEFKEGLIN